MHWYTKASTAYFMKRFRLLLSLVCGIFLFNILFYFFWVRPAGLERDKQQRLYGEMRKAIAGGDTLQQRYFQAGKDMEIFESRLLKREEEIKLIQEITAFSLHANLTLKNAHYSQKYLKEEGLWFYIMELPFTGRYRAIKDLLAEVRGSPYVLCIERLKINRAKNGSLEFSLTVASYLR